MTKNSMPGRQRAAGRRWAAAAAVVVSGLGLAGCAELSLPRALRIASGATSFTLCSSVFIAGQDADAVYRDEVRPEPGMGLVAWALDYQVDRQRREVHTRLAGRVDRRAVFRDGEGCLLLAPGAEPPPPVATLAGPAPAPDPWGATPQPAADARLAQAIDAAFTENPTPPWRHTQAVVVLHHGRLLGERYAPGVGLDTALSGHSVSKSVVSALVGIAVRQGRLDADAPAPVPEWQAAGDARAAITPDLLMRMASGLPADETAAGWDAATRMWFDETDMAGFAAQGQLAAPPGTAWHYSNRSTLLLSRLLRDAAGGNAGAVRRWVQQELVEPLGLRTLSLNFDAQGTPVGSSNFFASARDWARFGQLYLDDGLAGGRQVLPPGWVARSRQPTLGQGYGAGFWLNQTDARNPWGGRWGLPGAPADAYFARGHLGQFVVVVPSQQLVVVRLGLSHRPDGEIASVGRLVAEVVQALAAGDR